MNRISNASISREFSISSSIEVDIRHNLAVQHLVAAAKLRDLCAEVEENHQGEALGDFFTDIQSFVVPAIFASVASVEANINELYADVIGGSQALPNIDKKQVSAIWPQIADKPILEKYQFTLSLAERERFLTSSEPYQSVRLLIKARNALVHFKPEWNSSQEAHRKIGNHLEGKFVMSPFIGNSSPIFPVRCMTHGFIDWAILAVYALVKHFCSTLEVQNRYDPRSRFIRITA